MKFYNTDFFIKICKTFIFGFKLDTSNSQFACRWTCITAHLQHNSLVCTGGKICFHKSCREKLNTHMMPELTASQALYLLTHSTVQSPSWAANWFAASQEIPRISQNPKVHHRTHKRLPPVSIQGQPNPVHIPTSHLLEIIPNIIHPSMPRFPQGSLTLRFPHQDPIHPPLLTHTSLQPFKIIRQKCINTLEPLHYTHGL